MGINPLASYWLSNIHIRFASQNDLPALEWNGEYAHFRRLYQEIYQNTIQGKVVMWVVDLPGNGVIGQLFVQLDSDRRELADGQQRAYVHGFRVKPFYRGYGVGARLLYVVEADLMQRRFHWITLNVERQNQDACRFYEQHGYHIIAAEPGRWFYVDHQGYRREISEPAWRMQKFIA